MTRLMDSKPSPALVVAVVALVAAVAGTAMAGPTASTSALNKKKAKAIAKKQANKQINKRAPGLSVANADQLGEVDADQYQQRLFAVVREDGTLARGANAVGAEKAASVVYDVTFNRNVRECAFNATVGRPDDIVSEVGFATVNRDPTDANGARVFTYNATGAGAARPFHLEVAC